MGGRWPRLGALRAETGSVAAEFAVTLPAVVLVLAMCVGAVVGAAVFVQAQDAAGEVARLAARGDEYTPALAAARAEAEASVWDDGELRCARVSLPVRIAGIPLAARAEATSCALRDVAA